MLCTIMLPHATFTVKTKAEKEMIIDGDIRPAGYEHEELLSLCVVVLREDVASRSAAAALVIEKADRVQNAVINYLLKSKRTAGFELVSVEASLDSLSDLTLHPSETKLGLKDSVTINNLA